MEKVHNIRSSASNAIANKSAMGNKTTTNDKKRRNSPRNVVKETNENGKIKDNENENPRMKRGITACIEIEHTGKRKNVHDDHNEEENLSKRRKVIFETKSTKDRRL